MPPSAVGLKLSKKAAPLFIPNYIQDIKRPIGNVANIFYDSSEWPYWRNHLRPVLYYIGLDDDVVSGTEGMMAPQYEEDERAWVPSRVSVLVDDTEWVEVAPDESSWQLALPGPS